MYATGQRFVAASLVHVIITEGGGAVLLDLQTDQFLGLDQMGMLLWTLFTEGYTPQEVAHMIADCYTLESVTKVQDDIFHFLQQMETLHLLLPMQGTVSLNYPFPQQIREPFLVRILDLLAKRNWTCSLGEWIEAWLLLRWVHSFLVHGRLIDLSRRLHALPTKQPSTYENPLVRRLAERVHSAAAWQPFRAVCLHQNLALGFMMRHRMFHADLAIGVSTFPFFAHAWLKSGTEVIHWEVGLGPGMNLPRIQQLSLIFCTEWLSHKGVASGGKQ